MRALASLTAVCLLLTLPISAQQGPEGRSNLGTSAFESYLELLRQQAGIPAVSGVLIQNGEIVWERGLGLANQEARIGATPGTPYLIGDLTQMFSTVLLLQCVEQRRLSLDVPLRAPRVDLDPNATLRQVLSHISTDSGVFQYDPARFAHLAGVMENCAPQPFRKSIAHRLLEFLAMVDSAPGHDFLQGRVVPDGLFTEAALDRYARVLEDLAVPYRVDSRGRSSRNQVAPDGINAATGMVSTARDLARFSAALDDGVLLRPETLTVAWSPTAQRDGRPAPMGLGWFTQTYRGTPVVWHFGLIPNAYSALFVKVPSRGATMVLLANSDGLAMPFRLDQGDVTRSPFAALFLRMLL